MNIEELKVEMLRHKDTGETLAAALNISRQTLSSKMNGKNNRDFSQSEIAIIKNRYDLPDNRVIEIFFAN